jgi:hypothetical protein
MDKSIEDFLEKFANTKLGAHLQAYLDRVEPAFHKMSGINCDICGTPMEVDCKERKLHRFGDGEWIDEPDYVKFDYRGIECEILRNYVGALCGYVHVPEGHSWFGIPYEEIDCDIHGGLTLGEHVIYPDDGKYGYLNDCKYGYLIAFDCSHATDISPEIEKHLSVASKRDDRPKGFEKIMDMREHFKIWNKPTYKNIAYVKAEIERLVDQMLDAVKHE